MHHSPMPTEAFEQYRRQIEEAGEKLGATGKHPEGKLTKEDEGEIRFAVLAHEGKVVIDFNKPVAWMGMNAEQAINLGALLIAKGKQVRRKF